MSDFFFVSTIISLDFGIVPTIWLFFFALYVKTRIHSIRSDYDTFYDERKRKSYICVFEQCWVLGTLSKDVLTLQLTALMCLNLSLNESLISNKT